MNDNEFGIILDDNENIIKKFKPNKLRYIWINFLFTLIIALIFCLPLIISGVFALNGAANQDDQGGAIALMAFGGIGVLIFIAAIISTFVMYKKTWYALTNKRVIIRTGFIGVDFRSLDLISIGAVNVRVDFLDKLVKKPGTGTIKFGSMSLPINGAEGTNQAFTFSHIDNPYEIYKILKEYINAAKPDTK